MSADTNILREYLIALGFKIDTTEHDKFVKKVGAVDKGVSGLGKTLLGVAAAAAAMVTSFAGQMEKLYYASQRSGASANNLKALDYAAQQVGVSSDAMRAAVTNLGTTIRSNPGIKEFIEGILGHDITGEDTADTMVELLKSLRQLENEGPQGVATANNIAGMLGIDPDTLFMLTKNLDAFIAAEKKQKEMMKGAGVDADKAAAAGKEYAQQLREIGTQAGLLKDALAVKLLPEFKEFAGVLKEVLGDWIDLIHRDPPKEGWFAEFLEGLGLKPVPGVRAHPLDPNRKPPPDVPHPAAQAPRPLPAPRTGAQPAAADAQKPLGLRLHNPGNLRSWGSAPIINGFASFASDEEGLSAMAGNLVSYAFSHGWKTVKDVVDHWAPAQDHNNTAAYIEHVAKALGVAPDKELNLGDAQTMSNLMHAMIQQEQGYDPFDQAKLGKAAAARLPVTIQQKTDIHVHADPDPHRTAQTVAKEQNTVNADLVRSAGVVR